MENTDDVSQLRALFQAMSEAVVVHDKHGRIIRYNKSALKILGLSADQLLGKTAYDPQWRVINEDFTPVHPERTPSTITRKTGVPKENVIMGIFQPGGELRWVNVSAIPVTKDEDSEFHEVMVTFTDITEQKMGREKLILLQYELTQRKKFLDTTLNALPSLVSYISGNLTYGYMNQAYEKWFGVRLEDHLGKPIADLLGPKAMEVLKPHLEGVLRGEVQNFTNLIPYHGAGDRHVDVTYVPDISSGTVRGFYAIINDITAMVNIRQSIERKEVELRLILDSLPALIGHWDANLINLHANAAYAEYFGWPPEKVKGHHLSELLGPELFKLNEPYLKKALQGEAQIFERKIPLPKGGDKHTIAHYLPEIHNGKVIGIFVIVNDVTAIKESLRKEHEARHLAEMATKMRDDMVAVVSHDLQNPLTIIKISTQLLLRKKDLDPSLKKNLMNVIHSADTMLNMIHDLLDINKIEQGQFDVEEGMEDQNVKSWLNEVLELQSVLYREKKVNFELQLPDDIPELRFNSLHMKRVIQNLLGNAVKFTPEGGTIKLSVKRDGPVVTFALEDSGMGIEADLLPLVFERFTQSSKTAHKGHGLGLAICKGIVESHGGKIWVESTPGQGSTFFFTLPLSRHSEAQPQLH